MAKTAKMSKKKKTPWRLITIIGVIVGLIYVWFYASQYGQWADLTKQTKLLESENSELETQIAKLGREQTIIISDEAVFQKATKELQMHRARINERDYLPDPRDWKPEP
jgi:hypothetical protein